MPPEKKDDLDLKRTSRVEPGTLRGPYSKPEIRAIKLDSAVSSGPSGPGDATGFLGHPA